MLGRGNHRMIDDTSDTTIGVNIERFKAQTLIGLYSTVQ